MNTSTAASPTVSGNSGIKLTFQNNNKYEMIPANTNSFLLDSIMKTSFSNSIKIFVFGLILFSSSMVYGQSRFTIIGTGQKIQNGDTLYLSYNVDGKYILVTTIAKNRKFEFSGIVEQPVKANIYRNENPELVDFITESVSVYLEPDTIKINIPNTLTGAVISGTDLNDTLQILQNKLSKLKHEISTIKDPDLFTKEEKKDTALLNHNKRKLENIFYEIVDIELSFTDKHPNSRVSLDILYNRARINDRIDKVEMVYNKLAEYLKQTPQGNFIKETITKKKQVVIGMKALDFTMIDSKGKTISLSSYKGKYVLLDFWASWCGPCREEHPNLISIYENYKNNNFVILSVSIDTDKGKWLKAIEKDKLIWSQVSDLKGNDGEVYLGYGITSIPANFLIDPENTIIAKDLKGDLLKDELAKIFSKDK